MPRPTTWRSPTRGAPAERAPQGAETPTPETSTPEPATRASQGWAGPSHDWTGAASDRAVWDRADGRVFARATAPIATARPALYTPEQRRRRDATVWTLVQGVLAPLQFLVFLVSLGLVLRFLATGQGQFAAEASIVVKTLALYAIMITGSIWEKAVFDRWLLAPAFYWEDVVSFLVLALHTAYLVALFAGWGGAQAQMALALAAYASYVVNAGQFVWKLRRARLDSAAERAGRPLSSGAQPAPAAPIRGTPA